MMPSLTTPEIAADTNTDWSPSSAILSDGGRISFIPATPALMPEMMASVDTEPFFRTCISTERLPSTCTMLVCGGLPSRTVATSRI